MYQLKVVAGPNRGAIFPLSEGETSIGRQGDNVIVLPSNRVSKKHCVLSISQNEVTVSDQGSSNGTFVNGVLSRNKRIRTGDRIGVGEFVFEVVNPNASRSPAVISNSNVIQFPGPVTPVDLSALHHGYANANAATPGNAEPQDLKEKIKWNLEKYIMPFFYGLMVKTEWRMLMTLLFAMILISNLVIGFIPVMDANQSAVVREAQKRAKLIAREIVDRNAAAVAAGADSKTEIGSIANDEGVAVAALLDAKGRIIAPASRSNQQLLGEEGNFAAQAADLFTKGREVGVSRILEEEGKLIVVEPVRVVDPALARNVVRAMALVSLDLGVTAPGTGTMGLLFSKAFIISCVLGGIIFFIMYRMTMKPFEVLNTDIDQILKGHAHQLSNEFKWSELNQLIDVIHSSLQRLPKEDGLGGVGGEPAITSDDLIRSFKPLGDAPGFGLVILDAEKRILYINGHFEDLSGIRSDNAQGSELPAVARDQSLSSLFKEMIDQASGGFSVTEDYEFKGTFHNVTVSAVGAGGKTKGYLLWSAKKDNG